MKVPFLNLAAQHRSLRPLLERAFTEVMDSSAFAGGPFVEHFEKQFAAACGCRYAVGVGSGTEALWLALLAAGIGPGDEVITVPMTFMATAEAITYAGARPVFVDIDDLTYTMDVNRLAEAVTRKTKAIIPVHLFGQCADMQPILSFADRHGLIVIEDAAQAHGARYGDAVAGTLGRAGCFSFYPGKNLGALGEAGAVVTNEFELQDRIRTLRDHGQVQKYRHNMVGWNCRMDGIQAAALRIKLEYLESWNELRRTRAAQYAGRLAHVSNVRLPFEASYGRHVYHVYAVRVSGRDRILAMLRSDGVECAIHYPVPVHLQEAYRNLNYGPGDFPVAERFANECISLPMFPELDEDQLAYTCERLSAALNMAIAA